MTMLAAPPLDAFLTRARRRLDARPDPGATPTGDHYLDQPDGFVAPAGLKEAAVLVPVLPHDDGPRLLMTERSAALRNHSGQIAFPGGRCDPDDDGPRGTALRESFEEIGLPESSIEVLGYLPPYVSGTGYRIMPVVGLVHTPVTLSLNPSEVAGTFECPLDFLMTPGNQHVEEGFWRGAHRRTWVMTWQEHRIWGVTAGIIRQFYERMYA